MPFSTALWQTRAFDFSKPSREHKSGKESPTPNLTPKQKLDWSPLPGPQANAYHTEADEVFYGGAAGGGKTDLLLGLALTQHRRSVVFRREFPQLRAIIERSREIIGEHGKFNGQANLWRISDGRLLEFGAVQHEWDKQRYQGRPHDLKAFDELPQFTRSQYEFLIAWNRTEDPRQRCRVVSAGNPPVPGQDGAWIIDLWAPWLDPEYADPAEPGELRWYAQLGGELVWVESGEPFDHEGETVYPKSRTFIPARVTDNPFLVESGYVKTLQALPEPLRSQLLYGDFAAGGEDDPWQVIPTAWVRAAQARWREQPRPDVLMTALGVDVARGGKDKTVLAPRYGPWFAPLQKHPGHTTPDGPSVAALVLQALEGGSREFPPAVNLDSIAVGSSPLDILHANDVPANGVNFASGSTATDRSGKFKLRNLRAEAYWKLREALDPENGDGLALPDDRELLSDLCAPRYTLTAAGIGIESKDEIALRLGRSPDCGDALVLAHLYSSVGGQIGVVPRKRPQKHRW